MRFQPQLISLAVASLLSACSDAPAGPNSFDLAILNTTVPSDSVPIFVTGTVKNVGFTEFETILVTAVWHDSSGKPIDSRKGVVDGALAPGSTAFFLTHPTMDARAKEFRLEFRNSNGELLTTTRKNSNASRRTSPEEAAKPAPSANLALVDVRRNDLIRSDGTTRAVRIEGAIKNVSDERFDGSVQITWRNARNQLIDTRSIVLDVRPLMPGQESPFSALIENPTAEKYELKYRVNSSDEFAAVAQLASAEPEFSKLNKDRVRQKITGEWVLTEVLVPGVPLGRCKKLKIELSPQGDYAVSESLDAYSNPNKTKGYAKTATGKYTLKRLEYSDTGEPFWRIGVKSGELALNLRLDEQTGFHVVKQVFSAEFKRGEGFKPLVRIH